MEVQNLIGKRFSRLIVMSQEPSIKGQRAWSCLCDCGKMTIVITSRLNSGNTRSCGCLQVEKFRTGSKKHGMSLTKEYHAYAQMKNRCYYRSDSGYKNYGGRGIKVCDRWLNSFDNFIKDMGLAPSKNHSLDRIEVNGNYDPNNCRWATRTEQANNTRRNNFIEFNGTTLTLGQWASKLGMKYSCLLSRFKRGWSVIDTFTKPLMQ